MIHGGRTISRLAVSFEKELGCIRDWENLRRTGIPVRSERVAQYMSFTVQQQKKSGVLVKQAPANVAEPFIQGFDSDEGEPWVYDIVFGKGFNCEGHYVFTVACNTTKRGDELVNTLIQRIMRLPNKSGLLLNFQRGKTQRDEADHVLAVEYDRESLTLGPVTAVERYVEVAKAVEWDMAAGYLLSATSGRRQAPRRESKPVTATYMTAELKKHAKAANLEQELSTNSFRAGGGELPGVGGGVTFEGNAERAYWKDPKTAWRCMRLMEVVAPGAGTEGMVEGLTKEQYRELNEFPLSEQNRSLAAFGHKPFMYNDYYNDHLRLLILCQKRVYFF